MIKSAEAKKLCLIGPKHSGKSTTAAAAARLYGGIYVDLDDLLTAQTGKTPRNLYRESPALFQEAELAALEYTLSIDEGQLLVIAAGGGIIDNPKAAALLSAADLVLIYLALDAQTAWLRIKAEPLPPFLQTPDPQETHRLLHERRSARYRMLAHLVIAADGKTPEQIAHEIMLRIVELSLV
jgi:shikimate kinase